MEIDSTKYKNMEIDDLWKKTYEPKEKSNVPDETDEPQHLNPIGKCVIDTSMFTS